MMKIFIFLLLLSPSSWAQQGHDLDEVMESFMQERRKMMESIMEMFHEDEGLFDDSFFKDNSFFDSSKKFGRGQNIAIEEINESDGSITLLIKPKNKDVNLDIETKENAIIIKSETKVSEENEKEGSRVSNYSMSSFKKTIQIPRDFEAKSPQKEGDSIKISLVPSTKIKKVLKKSKKISEDKKPLFKMNDEDVI